MPKQIVDVLVPVALDQAYSYRVPAGLDLALGDLVRVPLGPRKATGAVWGHGVARPGLDNRLKDVAEKLEIPALKPELRNFIDWVADYTLSSRGMVLRMALRMGEQLGPERPRVAVRLAGPIPLRMTPARKKVLALLADGLLRPKRDVVEEAGVSPGVIDGLVDEGTLETAALAPEPVARPPGPDFAVPDLSPAQAEAAAALRARIAAGGYAVTLIDGVTGSGKTAVYFEAVAEMIRRSRQTLVLMPEIALTAQFLDRFTERFGVRPAEWHSGLSPRVRARTWAAAANGEVQVVAGARSALFLPYADLGLIIVDEEHDPAYKQEDGVRYHARDMAVVRAHIAKIPIVLASATPSVETEVNARRGRYARLSLPAPTRVPPLRVLHAAARGVPQMRGEGLVRRLRARRRAARGRGRRAVPAKTHPGALERSRRHHRAPEGGARRHRAGQGRPCHRHPARRQGPPFPETQPGGHRRRRPGAGVRRPASRGEKLPIAAPGRRPCRTRGREGRPRPRPDPDAPAGPSGDAGAHRGRPRGVLRGRDRRARAQRLSAVRAPCEPRRLRAGPPGRRRICTETRRRGAEER